MANRIPRWLLAIRIATARIRRGQRVWLVCDEAGRYHIL